MKTPLTPDEEEKQGMILALVIVSIIGLFFIAWIQFLFR